MTSEIYGSPRKLIALLNLFTQVEKVLSHPAVISYLSPKFNSSIGGNVTSITLL